MLYSFYKNYFIVRSDLLMLALIIGFSVGAFVYGTVVIIKRAKRKHKKSLKEKEE